MHSLFVVQRVSESFRRLDLPDNVLIGLSGGADSVALLLALRTFSREHALHLSAVYINHGLRSAAAEEERFCERLCGENDIPFMSGGCMFLHPAAWKPRRVKSDTVRSARCCRKPGPTCWRWRIIWMTRRRRCCCTCCHTGGPMGWAACASTGRLYGVRCWACCGIPALRPAGAGQEWREDECSADTRFT